MQFGFQRSNVGFQRRNVGFQDGNVRTDGTYLGPHEVFRGKIVMLLHNGVRNGFGLFLRDAGDDKVFGDGKRADHGFSRVL